MTVTSSNKYLSHSPVKSSQQHISTDASSSTSNKIQVNKRVNENSDDDELAIKRKRTSTAYTNQNVVSNENSELQSTFNVFDILSESDRAIRSSDNDEKTKLLFTPTIRSVSPTDNKLHILSLLRKYINIRPPAKEMISAEIKSSTDTLLNSVEAHDPLPEIHKNISVSPLNCETSAQCHTAGEQAKMKSIRKSQIQHRVIPESTDVEFTTSVSLDQSLSSTVPYVPLRPLSVTPPSFESLPAKTSDHMIIQTEKPLRRTKSVEILDIKSEPVHRHELNLTRSSITIKPCDISSSINADNVFPLIAPRFHFPFEVSRNTQTTTLCSSTTCSSLSIDPAIQQRTINTRSSLLTTNISISNQDLTQTSQRLNSTSRDDLQVRNEIQVILNGFNDQFQQLLFDLSGKIESCLQSIRMQYEKDLEEARRSYLVSLNELRTVTTEQMQEIRNKLELQYWKRLSEMRKRYESKLQYQ